LLLLVKFPFKIGAIFIFLLYRTLYPHLDKNCNIYKHGKNWYCEIDNIKMYYQGWTENDMVGYLDQNIMVNGDTYLIYKSPATIYGKAKLIQKNFNSVEEFRKFVAKKNKIAKIVGIIFPAIILVLLRSHS